MDSMATTHLGLGHTKTAETTTFGVRLRDANSPAGEFSSNLNAMASPSAANGWVIFDGDLFNTPISDGVEDVTGSTRS